MQLLKKEKGYTLTFTIAVIALVLFLVTALGGLLAAETRLGMQTWLRGQAYYAACAGMTRAFTDLEQGITDDSGFVPGAGGLEGAIGGGSYRVTQSVGQSLYDIVTSVGMAGGAKYTLSRTIEMPYGFCNPLLKYSLFAGGNLLFPLPFHWPDHIPFPLPGPFSLPSIVALGSITVQNYYPGTPLSNFYAKGSVIFLHANNNRHAGHSHNQSAIDAYIYAGADGRQIYDLDGQLSAQQIGGFPGRYSSADAAFADSLYTDSTQQFISDFLKNIPEPEIYQSDVPVVINKGNNPFAQGYRVVIAPCVEVDIPHLETGSRPCVIVAWGWGPSSSITADPNVQSIDGMMVSQGSLFTLDQNLLVKGSVIALNGLGLSGNLAVKYIPGLLIP